MTSIKDLKDIAHYLWEIPKSHRSDMRAPARLYCTSEMLKLMNDDHSLEQLANIATLPGIERYAIAMPDIHQGYGFPIGGVAALRTSDGVISPGGVGYDINCGVRLLVSNTTQSDAKESLEKLARQIQRDVPSGVGRGGEFSLNKNEIAEVLNTGAGWALKNGFAEEVDLDVTEEAGCFEEADADSVSDLAKERGKDQLGTIGSGNHFVEIQEVDEIHDEAIAHNFGLSKGQLTVMIHTGSRGLGHQTCTDYVKLMNQVMAKYSIRLPDRELACAPFKSPEGRSYFSAMGGAANFAWANRQIITHQVRRAWKRVLGASGGDLRILYDVAHNIAKLEHHGGKELIVHRKGATRSFGPGREEVPEAYRSHGQPVLIPGSMGTFSYVLCGTEHAMQETFGSCCHGAGRRLSRMRAKKSLDLERLKRELQEYGVVVCAASARGLLEEAPQAYKDVTEVIEAVSNSALAKVVVRLKPVAVIKG